MKFIGSFFRFASRVIAAAKRGGLSAIDLRKLDGLLTRAGRRNTVLAKGILTALNASGASERDISRFGDLLHRAEKRISDGKDPFTAPDRKELSGIFNRAYLSTRVERWFSDQLDELLAEEINEFITGSRRVEIGVPRKKTVRFEREEEKEKERKRTEKQKKIRQ